MRKEYAVKLFLIVALSFIHFYCSKINYDKFSKLYNIANEIEAAIKTDINYDNYIVLIQRFTSEKELIN